MMENTWVWQVVLGVGVLAGLTFLVAYARKARGLWHHYPLGWHLMGFTGSLTVALALLLYGSVFGPVHPNVWLVVVTAIVGMMVQRVWIVFTTDHKGRKS